MNGGTRINGEAPSKKKIHEKKWVQVAAVLTGLATLIGSLTALVSALGVDRLITRKAEVNSAETKAAYTALKAETETLRQALDRLREYTKKNGHRSRKNADDIADLKGDLRALHWARGARVEAPPPVPTAAPFEEEVLVLPEPAPLPKFEEIQEQAHRER